ncbi:hypothetical protein [Methylobacterium sp. CM6246]
MQLAHPLPDAPDPHQHAVEALDPIQAIRLGLEEFFAALGVFVDFEAPLAAEGDRS